MSLRGLLVLLALLAAAVALVLYLKPPPAKKAAEEGPLVAPFDEAKVTAVDLACGGTVALERSRGNGWRMTAPEAAEADPRVVHATLTALADARVRKVIEDIGAAGAPYGLDPPDCTAKLTIRGETAPRTLALGRTSPVGTERYARDAKGRIVFADGSLYTALAKPAADFRERRLIPVEPETITAIEIDRPSGRLAVERSGTSWRMTAPVADAAADSACTDLARAVATMEVDAVRKGLRPENVKADRRIGVRVTVSDGSPPREAFVATAGVEGKRLAWRSGGAFAGLVPEARAAELERDANHYRDPHPASFSAPDVRTIEIRRGGGSLRISRPTDAASWTVAENGGKGRAADRSRVDAFVDSVRWASAAGFRAAPPPTPATGRIVVSGDKGKGIADLSWGPLPPGAGGAESVWVTTPSRPGVVFALKASAFGPIPSKPADVLPRPSPSPRATPTPSPSPAPSS